MPGDERSEREQAIDRYLADLVGAQLSGKGELPTPPPDVTERELIRAAARRLGITEQWFRRHYWKTIREKNIKREAEIAQLRKLLRD